MLYAFRLWGCAFGASTFQHFWLQVMGGGEEGKSLIDFLLTSKLHCSRSLEFVGKTPLHKLLNSSCCLVSSAQLLLVLSPLLASTSIFAFYAMLSSVIFNVYRVFIFNVPFLVEASCWLSFCYLCLLLIFCSLQTPFRRPRKANKKSTPIFVCLCL